MVCQRDVDSGLIVRKLILAHTIILQLNAGTYIYTKLFIVVLESFSVSKVLNCFLSRVFIFRKSYFPVTEFFLVIAVLC